VVTESPYGDDIKSAVEVGLVRAARWRQSVLREAVVMAWYRAQAQDAATPLIAKWEPILGVKVNHTIIRRMRTRWGSCTPTRRTVRLNTELAKKPHECLEYVVVHELVHLLEPSHNATFIAYMDKFLPQWRHFRDELNRAPLGHVEWEY
jgi:predicted metal-dependent hydrolase